MRLRVLSDLHLEFNPLSLADVDCDAVILAGDIGPLRHVNTPTWARQQSPKREIIWVLGNHEHYGWYFGGFEKRFAAARELARAVGIHLLENEFVELGGARFLGCTLWTDFMLQGTPEESMLHARQQMGDFDGEIRISTPEGETRFFRPADSVEIHRKSVAWLDRTLAIPHPGPTVVITHHAPHPRCEHPFFVGKSLSPAFCNDLEWLIEKHAPALWISGHTHASHDFRLGNTRLISNQRGYSDRAEHDDAPFRREFVVEI